MTPRERRTFLVASLILFLASGARYVHERRVGPPVLPPDSAGMGAALLEGTREARDEAERRRRPLADGETIDPNRAPPEELDRLPGVGRAVADRIVEAREGGGAFRSAADLERVRGIGPATVRRLAPRLDFSRPPPVTLNRPPPGGREFGAGESGGRESSDTPGATSEGGAAIGESGNRVVDVNRAGAEELQALRGVGPVLAERILELRRDKGRFRTVDELLEVRGVGPATLESLRPMIRVGP